LSRTNANVRCMTLDSPVLRGLTHKHKFEDGKESIERKAGLFRCSE